jgi:phosphatidylserine/phosphatidylglycerophosphate/cardiolipin synthase-like enzyme
VWVVLGLLAAHPAWGVIALALLLDTVAETRARAPNIADLVELVWTGPESLGVSNRDTAVVVRELFGTATNEVLVAGFAVYQGREVFRRLAERMEELPALRVRLYLDVGRPHGDVTASSDLVWRFLSRFRTTEWPGEKLPELYYDPRSLDENQEKRSSLHAKCVVVDRRIAFVTSANFTEAAHSRNIEVGALIRSPVFAQELANHFDSLAAAAALCPFPASGSKVV